MNYPKNYEWLSSVGQLPKLLTEFLSIYGVKEIKGSQHNPIIMGWAKMLGLKQYTADEIAWCGLAMAWVVKQSGYDVVKDPLWALNWSNFGEKTNTPSLGDIMVFERRDSAGKFIGGHVGVYIAEDKDCYHVLGGNTSDQVMISRILKSRLKSANRPLFKIGKPNSVKPYQVAAKGLITTNEA